MEGKRGHAAVHKRRGLKGKTVALLLSAAVVLGGTIGGTLAWLTDQTDPVENTFTVGEVKIDLKEHEYDQDTEKLGDDIVTENSYKFVPGDTLPKDPFATVKGGSEKCYLFVHVEEINNTATGLTGKIINWTPDSNWTPVTGQTEYWYRIVEASDTDQDFYILSGTGNNVNGQITVNPDVTKEMVSSINANKPQLIFTAAAIQYDNMADVNAAWANLPNAFKPAAP